MNDLKYDEENKYHYNDDYVFFTKSFLSQWYGAFRGQGSIFIMYSQFDKKARKFNCAEQAMMYSKAALFNDEETANEILSASHPKKQKDLGRQVKNFNPFKWDQEKVAIVTAINRAKFDQNLEIRKKLLNTGIRTLVEAAPWDNVWGIGMGVEDPNILNENLWKGQNCLGKSLMAVRKELYYNYYKVKGEE